MERVSRKVCVEVGSIASTCKAPRTGKEVKEWGDPRHDHQGDRDRPGGAGRRRRAPRAIRSTRCCEAEHGKRALHAARSTTSTGARPRASCAARAMLEGLDDYRGRARARLPERVAVAWLDGEPRRIDARPDLRARQRLRRRDRHGDAALRPARDRHRAAARRPFFSRRKGLEHVGPRAFGYDLDFRLGVRVMRRIGIDVGGTNTDAVLLEDGSVAAAVKTPTTAGRDRRHPRRARRAARRPALAARTSTP